MRKFMWGLGAAVALVAGAPAYADVTCTPAACDSPNAEFTISPAGVGPGFTGPISASIANAGITAGSFTDTFNFLLPYAGTGGGVVSSIAAVFQGITDVDFTAILVNGVTVASVGNGIVNGAVDVASASGILLAAGPNQVQIQGISRGNGSYGGALSFTPAVPELATWGMMILGFAAVGSAMRYRRRSTKVSFA